MDQSLIEVKDTVKGFFFAYAVKRNTIETLGYLTEDIRWIGSGAVPAAQGKRQVTQVLEAEFTADSAPYNVKYLAEEVRQIGAECAESFFEVELSKVLTDEEEVSLTVQLSVVCRRDGFLYKICSIHTTGVDNLAEEKALQTAEKTFAEYQNRFRDTSMNFLQQSIPGGIIGCYREPGFPLYFINDRMLQYLGYTEEELTFETEGYISRCIFPEDLTYVETFIDRRLREEEEYELRYRMKRQDKGIIWVMERGRKTVNDLGREVIIRVLFDITEVVELQEQMHHQEISLDAVNREMEDLYQTMVHGAAKIAYDDDFTILYANGAFYEMLGYTAEDFQQATANRAAALIHQEDLDELGQFLSGLHEEELHKNLHRRLRMRTHDQRWIWIQMEATLSSEISKGYPVFYCSFTDIEEQHTAELEQKRQQHFLSLITSAVMGGTAVTRRDAQRSFAYIDDNLLCCLGYRKGELQTVSQNALSPLVLEEDREATMLSITAQLKESPEYELEYRLIRQNGSVIWIREKGKLMEVQGEEPVLISLLLDITRQKAEQLQSVEKNRTDPLTGVLNQDFIKQSIRLFLEKKDDEQGAALLLADLDNFKKINDVYGHLEGDRILVRIAEIIREIFPKEHNLGRVDGDRFLILIPQLSCEQDAEEKAQALCQAVRSTFLHHFSNCPVTISVGAAISLPKEKASFKELYHVADEALYQAKFSGKNQYCVLDKKHLAHMELRQSPEEPESEQVMAPQNKDMLRDLTDSSRTQKTAIIFTAVVFFGAAAGILWAQLTRQPNSASLTEGLLGLMIVCPLVTALILNRLQKRVKTQLESVMEQCRQMLETEGNSQEQYRESPEKLTEALKAYQTKMEEASCFDPLLKIGNRTKAARDMEILIEKRKVQHISLFLLDIQEFSKYNDVFSIRTGDEIIKSVCHRLSKCFGENLYRVDGDVFLGIITEERKDQTVLEKVQLELEEPICINSIEIKIQYNLGISYYPANGENAVELLERAQSALNYAKKQQKINVVFYNESITSVLRREGEILSLLRRRIAEELLEVWYQPIYDTRTGSFSTAEALLRLRDDMGSFVEPYYAILVAEKNDAIGEIGEYVMRAACQTVRELRESGSNIENIHVNLSVQQVAQPNFAEHTLELIRNCGAAPCEIGVEVTETALIQSFESTVESLAMLKDAGVQIALDDFGSGYSSLNYLARLPIDKLKLDRQLVLQVNEGIEQLEFIKTIVQMARIKNMEVIAEGVEDEDILDKITRCDVEYIQGFYFSKPLPKNEFINFLRRNQQEKA